MDSERHCERCERPQPNSRRFRCTDCSRLVCRRCSTDLHRVSRCSDCRQARDERQMHAALCARFDAGDSAEQAADWWGCSREQARDHRRRWRQKD